MNATNIGSLPHKDPQSAIDLILKYTRRLPAWPQLPRRTFLENMYVQYSENFPGIVVDEGTAKIYVDSRRAFHELEKFYENVLSGNMNYFSVSDRYAAGIKRMIETLGRKPAGVEAVKGQCVGPLTFGLTVKDESGKAVFHDPQLRDVTIKHIILKSAWQIKTLADATGLGVMLFLDEPYLSAYGSAFTALSRDEAETTIKETVSGIKTAVAPLEALIGIHCCGNTDWSLLLDSDIDILSFDAYEFFDNLLLYSDKVGAFLSRGGRLAWGIVPTAEDALMKESAGSLITRLTDATGRLAAKGVDLSKVRDSFIFTPACGLGSRSEKAAETALRLASEIAYLAAEAFK